MIEPSVLSRFAGIVGPSHALSEPGAVAPYLEERLGRFPGHTPLVLRPGSVEEVSRIMRLATETRTPIVPQGGNTGLVGGQLPDASGAQLVLSLSRLNGIRELDTRSNTVTAEAGVVLQALQEAAEAADRLFPLSLGAQGSCQIGGNLSSNAGGTGVLAYGNARELCLGVEVVLPTGEVFDDLRKLKKDNTGYDLKDLFIGGEGTLGVITAAVLKLFPRARGRETAWVGLESAEAALALFELAQQRAGATLTAFELTAALPLSFALRHVPGIVAPLQADWPWLVLMEVSSARSAEDARELTEGLLGEAIESGLVGDAVLASGLAQQAAFWRVREAIPEAQPYEGASIKHDLAVPIGAIGAFIARAEPLVFAICPGARPLCFGHVGDGNLHYNISQPRGMDRQAFLALTPAFNRALHELARDLGGTFSAEHGIGQMKREELIATQPAIATDLMRRIRAAFDPAGIMNPGKVI